MNPQEQCLLIRLLYVILYECFLRAVKSFDELRRTDRTIDDHLNRRSSGLVTHN